MKPPPEQQKPFRSETAGEIKVSRRQHAFKAIVPLLGGWRRNHHPVEARISVDYSGNAHRLQVPWKSQHTQDGYDTAAQPSLEY